jgi:lysophospholipase L1-like esterase
MKKVLQLATLMAVMTGAAFAQAKPIKIVLVGDSTTAVQGGWGPSFCSAVAPSVKCVDLGRNGRSTKSYLDEGLWAKALEEHGSLYLIQFGHNDEKNDAIRHTDPETTFAENIRRMVRDVKAQGGEVVLLSPLARRTFVNGKPSNPDLRLFGNASQRVAREEHVEFLDLLTLSEARLAQGTQADADAFDMVGHDDAKAENSDKATPKLDRTHLNDAGKQVFGAIVAKDLVRLHPELSAVISTK